MVGTQSYQQLYARVSDNPAYNVSHPIVQLGFVVKFLRSSTGWLAGLCLCTFLRVLHRLRAREDERRGGRLHLGVHLEEGLDDVVVGAAVVHQQLPQVVGRAQLGHDLGAVRADQHEFPEDGVEKLRANSTLWTKMYA